MKSKLYRLKSWLTLDEAALHLASVISEEVSPSDILQLGLEGQLKLSVNLVNNAYVRKGEVKDLMDTPVMLAMPGGVFPTLKKEEDIPPGSLEDECRRLSGKSYGEIIEQCSDEMAYAVSERRVLTAPLGDHVKGSSYVRFMGDVFNAVGVWDLPMLAGERIDVEECYQQLVGGPEVELTSIDGAWLEKEDGFLYCVHERFDHEYITEMLERESVERNEGRFGNPRHFYPAGRLPEGVSIVVRRENLDAFIVSLEDDSTEHQPDSGEALRALEALGLLAVTYAEGRKQYTHERSGKPNCAQIAKAMQPHAGEVYGMGESKLKRLLSDALAAWEEKRG